MVKNLPSNEEDAGSIHGQETKISHARGQLSPRPTVRSATALQLGTVCAPQRRLSMAKKIIIKLNFKKGMPGSRGILCNNSAKGDLLEKGAKEVGEPTTCM